MRTLNQHISESGDSNMDSQTKSLNKKPYRAPQLMNYGDIRQITRAVGMTNGAPDGSDMGMTKTAASAMGMA
jgi:hypothetical protein